MLKDLHTHVGMDKVHEWQRNSFFEDLPIARPTEHVRDIHVGYFGVKQFVDRNHVHYFEKSTLPEIALVEKLNADLAISLGLPVAPCVLRRDVPDPTLVSLGLYRNTWSLLQRRRSERAHHTDTPDTLFRLKDERSMILEAMGKEVRDDLHPTVQPYRELLSEMLPFLLWTRVDDPNLSNIMDRRAYANSKVPHSDHNTGYFIDLEADTSVITRETSYTETDPHAISLADLAPILRDWLVPHLRPADIFNTECVWRTTEAITSMPAQKISGQIEKMITLISHYPHLDQETKERYQKGCEDMHAVLLTRQGLLSEFVGSIIPKPPKMGLRPTTPSPKRA